MSLLDNIQQYKKLPFSSSYKEEIEHAEFYRLSFDASGVEYTTGQAPDGPVIHMLECEERKDYYSRAKQTPIRSYVSSILNKYNSSVFRNEPARDTESSLVAALYKDADGYGNPLNELMRQALLSSQIDADSYLMAASTATDTEILTIAQAQAAGVNPFIRLVKKESVANKTVVDGVLLEAIVLMADETGKEFARYMDREVFVDITLGKSYRVESLSDAYSHGYSSIPLAMIKPFKDSQAKPISYGQRSIINTLSLLQQEMNDSVFTKTILSGVRLPQDGEENKDNKINWSGKRVLVLEDPGANLQHLGADNNAATSLREQIKVEEENLYKSAGFSGSNANEVTNASGVSLAIQREDYFAICAALKRAIESAENYIIDVIASKERTEVAPSVYSDRFIVADRVEQLQCLRDLLAIDLPATFKKLAIREYIDMFYNVSEEDAKMIEEELSSDRVEQNNEA